MGSKILVKKGARTQLPFLIPDEPIPFWKVVRSLVGQDLTRVSMPVILNEPMSALACCCEPLMNSYHLLERAAECDDPVTRLALATACQVSLMQSCKVRKRKPFNPMLGETYEMVTENFRMLVEKYQHLPDQIAVYCMEGKGYKLWGQNQLELKVKFNYGRGLLDMNLIGAIDVYFEKYDEHITF